MNAVEVSENYWVIQYDDYVSEQKVKLNINKADKTTCYFVKVEDDTIIKKSMGIIPTVLQTPDEKTLENVLR